MTAYPGGHTAQLVLEKMAREFTGWIMARSELLYTFPGNGQRGRGETKTWTRGGTPNWSWR